MALPCWVTSTAGGPAATPGLGARLLYPSTSPPRPRILPASAPESPPRRRKYLCCLLPGKKAHGFRKLLLAPGLVTSDPGDELQTAGGGGGPRGGCWDSGQRLQVSPKRVTLPPRAGPAAAFRPQPPPRHLTRRSQSQSSPIPLARTSGSCSPPLGHLGCHRGASLSDARGPRRRRERAEPHAEHERQQQSGPRTHGERRQSGGGCSASAGSGRGGTARTPRLRAPGAGWGGDEAGPVGTRPEPAARSSQVQPSERTGDSERRAAEGAAGSVPGARALGAGLGASAGERQARSGAQELKGARGTYHFT